MKNSQEGFIVPLIIAIFTVLVIGGGAYVYLNKGIVKSENNLNSPKIEDNINIENSTILPSQDNGVKSENKNQASTQKEIYYTSLPYTAIRANVANMNVWAELYFDKYGTYVGICDSKNEKVKAEGIDKFLESTLKIVSSADVYCNASANAYVYSLRMPDGNSWCADSTTSLGSAISTSPKTLSCQNGVTNSNNKVQTTVNNPSSPLKTPVVAPAVDQQSAQDLQSIANIVASVSNFRQPAEAVYDSNSGSYSSLCSGGLINVTANSSFSSIIKSILDAQSVSNQSSAGIVCVANKDKYALEVTFKKYVVPDGAYLSGKHSYCVDSTGVSGDDTKYKIDQVNYNCKVQ